MRKTDPNDKKELKRIKNMISAYESRISKRSTIEDLTEQVRLRNQ